MPDITIFTKPGCPYCAALKNDLAKRGVQYSEYDVKNDSKNLQKMLNLNGGQRRVPTMVDGENVSVGFNGS